MASGLSDMKKSAFFNTIELDNFPKPPRSERARWPPLARVLTLAGNLAEAPRELCLKARIERWMVNEGYRRLVLGLFIVAHTMVFVFGFLNYQMKDNLTTARASLGVTYAIARAAALVLHFDVALILFPVCRSLISLARQTPLNGIVQFDKSVSFHKLIAASIVFFSLLHTFAHWNNFARLAAQNKLGFKGFLHLNFITGPGWSGYIMLLILLVIVVTSVEKLRRKNHERFYYTHHLFVVFFIFWSVHGAFCMIKPDAPPFCSNTGVFFEFWIYGGAMYLIERILREVRGRQKTFITKVIQHPSNVVEVQMKKERTKTRAGQYICLSCPEVSLWQFHPFTLTSAPEEDYLSVHIRCVGDFTKAFARSIGCDFERNNNPAVIAMGEKLDGTEVGPVTRRILPRVFIDGPFGSASEDVFKYEVAVLVGAGIGVTPFASILKSIWYRMNYPKTKTRLRKVYFFWVCRDFGSFEWFRSLLLAIEAQDLDSNIEIHTYLTARIRADDATNIMINDANAFQDAITGLRAPTNFGRPNWDAVFKSIRKIHKSAEAGVFYCGPKALATQLHVKCNLYSDPNFSFVWGKENF